jgi:hypothetical protein
MWPQLWPSLNVSVKPVVNRKDQLDALPPDVAAFKPSRYTGGTPLSGPASFDIRRVDRTMDRIVLLLIVCAIAFGVLWGALR